MRRAKHRPPHKRTGNWNPPRDCFQRAGRRMLELCNDPRARLVHAKVRDSFHPCRWIDHAWVEMPGIADVTDDDGSNPREVPMQVVLDDTQPDPRARMLPRPIFDKHTEPRDEKHYTFAQMVEHALRHRHDGPWPD